MSRNPPTPLSPREREALAHLEQWGDGPEESRDRDAVIDQLTDRDFERAEADRLIDQLLLKGYCYEHDGIRVTDPP